MSRYIGPLLGVLLGVALSPGRSFAQNPLSAADDWSKWSGETRLAYVTAYLWGYGRGFRDGCVAGQRTYSAAEPAGLPGEECIPKHQTYIEEHGRLCARYHRLLSFVPLRSVRADFQSA